MKSTTLALLAIPFALSISSVSFAGGEEKPKQEQGQNQPSQNETKKEQPKQEKPEQNQGQRLFR